MTDRDISRTSAGYVVCVNPNAAFSIIYEDGLGKLFFVIEVDDEPKKIYLNPRPTENGLDVDVRDDTARKRLDFAIARVKEYFERRGVSVEVD